jgi:translocation and assembly module TamB
MRTPAQVVLRIAVALAIVLMACGIAGLVVVRSGWFHEKVRERILAEIEQATGGRAEIGGFHFDWSSLTASVSPLVLHGTEPGGEQPLLSVASASIGLRVISMFERKFDLAYLLVEKPVARIVFYPDGSTNIPVPRVRSTAAWTEDLLNLAVRRYEITDGIVEYDDRKIPLDIRGENLRTTLTFDSSGPRYRAEVRSAFRVMPVNLPPIIATVEAAATLERARIRFDLLRISTKDSRAELAGWLDDVRAPHGTLSMKASVSMAEAVGLFQLPLTRTGNAAFDGRVTISLARGFDYSFNGRAAARGFGFSYGRVNVENADARAEVRITPDQVSAAGISATALGAAFTGKADLAHWRDLRVEGAFDSIDVHRAAKLATDRAIPWNGQLSGTIAATATIGQPDAKIQASVAIAPPAEGQPIEGHVDAFYDQATGKLRLDNSLIATPSTRIEASGTLGEKLAVHAQSTDLDDVLPALAMLEENAPKTLPVKLNHGRAVFEGVVSGALDDLHAAGHAELVNASIEGHVFDRIAGDVEATANHVKLDRATVQRGPMDASGSALITARNGSFEDAAVAADVRARNLRLDEIAKEAKLDFAPSGTASAEMRVSGSVRSPEAEGTVQVDKPAAFGEQLDRLRARIRYSPTVIAVTDGEAGKSQARVDFSGSYRHSLNDFKNGEVAGTVDLRDAKLSQVEKMHALEPRLEARVDGKAAFSARIVSGEVEPQSVAGDATVRGATWNGQNAGDLTMHAETRGQDLFARMNAQLRQAALQGEGSWKLSGDDPGSATIRFARASVATLHDLVAIAGTPEQRSAVLPFEGFVEGGATLSVALKKPRDFRAEISIGSMQINPKAEQSLRLGVQAQDVILKNSKPVVIDLSAKEARIRSAEFTARDTSLEVSGAVPFDGKGADLAVRGSVNLVILQLLNRDLAARGNATVQAAVRGSLVDPQVFGRMELKNASLYLGDLPNGVDSANGAVVFDRNRVTIEKLTAETGGGTVNFSGFVGFGNALVYRVQAVAQNVRVRYPEDVSVNFNATLALNGTSESSTVSGIVTLNRASFTPRADVARILADFGKPSPASPVASSEYIRGMQFDVRVESGPNFQLQTSLTRNLEAEIDVRLRGTPLRPALLGTLSVNEGEIQVLGNRYTVNRGDIRFLNPLKIDPSFDINLETRVSAVTINIAMSGTLQKLSVNYSSDPALQPREIINLLAVGRSPTGTTGLSPDIGSTGSSSLTEAGGALIGQALSAQLSSRLQRFFGASRVKIDPTPSGVEYLPQARLTIEQQVSKDITLTYITNLNRTQEQTVQLEWDFSRDWSMIAGRDANGLFGIDFQIRKRVK